MTTGSFEKNSMGWQLQQLQQNAGEWWELQTNRLGKNVNLPEFSLNWINWTLLWEITKVVLLILIVALIAGIAWQLWQLFSPSFYRLGTRSRDTSQSKSAKEIAIAEWLKQSQQFKQQGDYYRAFRCLYFATLQRLSDRGIAPHQISRTDGEYLHIIQQLPHRQAYQFLLMTHQRLCFSDETASLALLEESQQAYQDIELAQRSTVPSPNSDR